MITNNPMQLKAFIKSKAAYSTLISSTPKHLFINQLH